MRSTDSQPENFNDARIQTFNCIFFLHSTFFQRVKSNHLLGCMMQIKACKNQIGTSSSSWVPIRKISHRDSEEKVGNSRLKIDFEVHHSVWKSLKNFVLLKLTCLVTLLPQTLKAFQKLVKLSFLGIFDELLSPQNVNVASMSFHSSMLSNFLASISWRQSIHLFWRHCPLQVLVIRNRTFEEEIVDVVAQLANLTRPKIGQKS